MVYWMPYKKSYRKHLALALILSACISIPCRFALAELSSEISTQCVALEAIEQQKQSLDSEAQRIREALLAKSKEIQALKERQAESNSPILSYRLQTLLQDAQTIASELN